MLNEIKFYLSDLTCLTCDLNDGNKCLTCDLTTRKLQDGNCVCKDGFVEITPLKSSQCLQCSENCITCDISKRNYCLSCGDENITFRQLVNGDCVCKSGYQAVTYQYACEVDTWDKRLLTFKFKTDTSHQYWQTVTKLFESKDTAISKRIFPQGLQKIQNFNITYNINRLGKQQFFNSSTNLKVKIINIWEGYSQQFSPKNCIFQFHHFLVY